MHSTQLEKEPKPHLKIAPKLQTSLNVVPKPPSASNPPNKQSTNPAEVVGFMPRRGDF